MSLLALRKTITLKSKGATMILILATLSLISTSYSFCPSQGSQSLRKIYVLRHVGNDYEYIPEKTAPPKWESDLTSSYPDGTPSSLRGEAVRSALRSSQCIGWTFPGSSPLNSGILQLSGEGCAEFLNNKFTSSFAKEDAPFFTETCLLNGKGRVVDKIGVARTRPDEAFLVTSPGHSGQDLFQRLDPYIFPLDRVALTKLDDFFAFDLVSTTLEDVRKVVSDQMNQQLGRSVPLPGSAGQVAADEKILVFPSTGLAKCAAEGYTFCFRDKDEGERIWEFLTSESNAQGPVAIGEAEWESLRIESATPRFGREMMAAQEDPEVTPTSPLEIHLENNVDTEKGCYLGQEGVASLLKNPRGPPRFLYQVLFDDDFNLYEAQNQDNPTRVPKIGDMLFCLGSNEEISVGAISSVAEPGSNGEQATLALALIKRSDSILKSMKERGLDLPAIKTDLTESSGMISPKPVKAPLEGLEVIVGGSFTVGRLQAPPTIVYNKRNMFENAVPDFVGELPDDHDGKFLMANRNHYEEEGTFPAIASESTNEEEDVVALEKAVSDAREEAKAAAAEADRKAAKMEMLQKRAAEAMERRKAAKEQQSQKQEALMPKNEEVDEEAEAKRKAEKMASLQKRAEEAIARRKKRQQ